MADGDLLPSSAGSFIFGGDTGLSYEDLQRRRAVAAAVASRSRAYPKTLGEGLTYFGESMGNALTERYLRQEAAAQRAKESGFISGAPPPSFTPPVGGNASPAAAASTVTPPPAGAPTVPITVPTTPTPAPRLGKMSEVGDAIGRAEPDETMRGYYTQLASREDPTGGQRVSPTGAAGPFQFTRGTGKQYGLFGEDGTDNRTDIEASVKAVQQLTRDNAKAFVEINGRMPTHSELALMHQQGGVTGARMVAGTGNAPSRNLAVNNVDPNASPQDAAAKIQAYYKMPDATMPEGYLGGGGGGGGGGRDAIARALTPQGAAPPTPLAAPAPSQTQVASLDPSIGANITAPPEAANNPPIVSDIKPAMQVAQAGTPTVPAPDAPPSREAIPPGSVQEMKDPGAAPTRPPILGPSKAQAYWSQFMNNPNVSPELRARATHQYQVEEAYRKEIETRQTSDYENTRGQYQTHRDAYDKFMREAPDRAIKQLIDRTGLEATRSKLEQDYYDKGIPRTQAREKAALDIQQATRTLAKPDTVSAQGTQFERPYDPTKPPDQQPGVYAVPKGLPAPEEKPLTEGQMKAVEFALKMDKDLGVLHSELKNGKALTDPWEATKAMAPIGSNYIVSDEYRRAKNIMGNFMASYLSHVSGASVTPSEYTRNVPAYMPSPGDTDKDLADKAQRQRDFLAATRAAGGQQANEAIRKEMDRAGQYLFDKRAEQPAVHVTSPAEAAKLEPGQWFITETGARKQRGRSP